MLTVLLLLAMLLPQAATPLRADGPAEPIHPLLGRLAAERPNDMVRVIVQGHNPNGELGQEIDRQGGANKKPLPLIGAVAAEMPAGKVRALAKNPNVRWVSVDAPVVPMDGGYISTANLATIYPQAVRAPEVWNGSPAYSGAGVTVAVVDSGIKQYQADFLDSSGTSRVLTTVKLSSTSNSANDGYGHGTHVAGIIGGNGKGSGGKYIGIAPEANLLNVKVSDDQGGIYVSDVVNGLQWVVQNRARYNIRIVNLALIATVAESYLTSPLDAAVELAWLSGIVVVVSAGNLGPDTALYAPANDPLVITVGAADTNGTAGLADDSVPAWSSYGRTQDGFSKPDVVAPGRQIVSNLASDGSVLAKQFPDRIVDQNYLRLSGTSMAAAVVSGLAALTLQAHPTWTPDQIKGTLMATARPLAATGSGAGEVDAAATVSTNAPRYANGSVPLALGVAGLAGTAAYTSATWNSATWNSATWNSATWNSATWNSATWNSATWNSATWNSATWNALGFD